MKSKFTKMNTFTYQILLKFRKSPSTNLPTAAVWSVCAAYVWRHLGHDPSATHQ